MEGLAPGYRFVPTDEELITEYLLKKEIGLPIPGRFVVERDVYEKSPWEVFNDGDPWQIFKSRDSKTRKIKTESTIYVLTSLKNASRNRFSRTAGCGSWHGVSGPDDILNDQDHVIGLKRVLNFEVMDDNDSSVFYGTNGLIKGHWMMHEYTLNGDCNSFVLCKITRDDSKNLKIAPNSRRKKNPQLGKRGRRCVSETEKGEEDNNSKRKRMMIHHHHHHHQNESDHPTATPELALPYQLPPLQDSLNASSVSAPLQSIPEMLSSDIDQLEDNFGIDYMDFSQIMDPNVCFTVEELLQLQPLELQRNSFGFHSQPLEEEILTSEEFEQQLEEDESLAFLI